jgi:hypothetical protein
MRDREEGEDPESNTALSETPAVPEPSPGRSPWIRPTLTDHGSMRTLLRAGSGGLPDKGAGMASQL